MESKIDIKLGDNSINFTLSNGEMIVENDNLSNIKIYKIHNIGTPKKMFTKLNVTTFGFGEYVFVYRNEYKVIINFSSENSFYYKLVKIELSDEFLVFG